MFHTLRTILAAATLTGAAQTINAQVSILFEETDTGVTCTYSGSLDTSNAVTYGPIAMQPNAGIHSGNANLASKSISATHCYRYTLSTTSASFGTATTFSAASSFSTDSESKFFNIAGKNGYLLIPESYDSVFSLSGSIAWAGETFSSLGLVAGTYIFSIGNSTASETITLTIPAAVPEPATYAAGVGIFALGLAALRRRRQSLAK